MHLSTIPLGPSTMNSVLTCFVSPQNCLLYSGTTGPAPASQQPMANQNYAPAAHATGFKDAKFDECITNVLSSGVSLRRKSEALNRIIELCQKNGGLDLAMLYKFTTLPEVVKSYVGRKPQMFSCQTFLVTSSPSIATLATHSS